MIWVLIFIIAILLVRNSEWFIVAVSNRRYHKAIEALEENLKKATENSEDNEKNTIISYKGYLKDLKDFFTIQQKIVYKFERAKERYAHNRKVRRNLVDDWDEYTQILDSIRIGDEAINAGTDPIYNYQDYQKLWIKMEEIEKRFDKMLQEKKAI